VPACAPQRWNARGVPHLAARDAGQVIAAADVADVVRGLYQAVAIFSRSAMEQERIVRPDLGPEVPEEQTLSHAPGASPGDES
jgi:hypothetical protein